MSGWALFILHLESLYHPAINLSSTKNYFSTLHYVLSTLSCTYHPGTVLGAGYTSKQDSEFPPSSTHNPWKHQACKQSHRREVLRRAQKERTPEPGEEAVQKCFLEEVTKLRSKRSRGTNQLQGKTEKNIPDNGNSLCRGARRVTNLRSRELSVCEKTFYGDGKKLTFYMSVPQNDYLLEAGGCIFKLLLWKSSLALGDLLIKNCVWAFYLLFINIY